MFITLNQYFRLLSLLFLDFVFVVNLLIHNLILYSVFKVQGLHFSQEDRFLGRPTNVFVQSGGE